MGASRLIKAGSKLHHFVYAPPLKGARKSKRKPPKPPYASAERSKWSVYYYWWEYLRRNDGYRLTCSKKGKGKYAKLYADFGDVHATDFWIWWGEHMQLFAEPSARSVEIVDANSLKGSAADTLFVKVPLENSIRFTVARFKRLIDPKLFKKSGAKQPSRAKYRVATKPVLASLHRHLVVWDARQANPKMDLQELADIAKVSYNNNFDGETLAQVKALGLASRDIQRALRRRKALVVKRHLRIAEQYIKNVADQGTFPLRTGR